MLKRLLSISIIIAAFFLSNNVFAQTDTTKNEHPAGEKDLATSKVKKGWNFGGVPAIAYSSDLGFLYGIILNVYHYGDGSNYPNYNHSLYIEWSRTTKGSGKNMLIYDNRTLIPNGRMTLEASYLTEQALNFYGFNGYQAYFGKEYLDQDDTTNYLSRLYYNHDRKLLRLRADFQGKTPVKNLRWFGGLSYYGLKVSSVDVEKLNEGKDEVDKLQDTSIYDAYVNWGVIPQDQKDGGNTTLVKLGLVYDTRDNDASPQKGIWSEAMIISAPGFLGNNYSYYKLSLTHRQYFTLFPKKLVFAYRLNYQGLIGGEIPFYMMPFYFRSKDVQDGLGGAKTLRGILRNRIVGDGAVLGNIELRYRFVNTVLFNQNFTITLGTFMDAARVVQFHDFDKSGVTASATKTKEENLNELEYQDEAFHISYGLGLHFALNNNFIVTADYGMAGNPQDGKRGLYIGLNYLF